MEILLVEEHTIVHQDPDPIVYTRVGGCSFITSSAWWKEAQAATGGLGLMLSSRARKALLQVYQLTERILIVNFDGSIREEELKEKTCSVEPARGEQQIEGHK